MTTYIYRNDQVEGPLTDAEIQARLCNGELTPQTPAWREGMAEWTTLEALYPAPTAAPAGSAPPIVRGAVPPRIAETPATAPGAPEKADDASSPDQELPLVNSVFESQTMPDPQADAFERLAAIAGKFLGRLENRLGLVARPTLGFYSHRVATTAIQRIRLDLLNGASLTPSGEAFIFEAAAYLAALAARNWKQRSLNGRGFAAFAPGSRDNHLLFFAERERDGQWDLYAQDFYEDLCRLLLRPPKMFPSMQKRFYLLDSLTLPSPEYLYLYGVFLMQSPSAGGNWPSSEKVGGTDEDFKRSRALLVDDLHADCGLPSDDKALRMLSWWVVFPPYGWDLNDGQDYNMMTVFDQISHKRIVPQDVGIDYLRALLKCQSIEIRNLAARCLMVYRVPPRDAVEALHYKQALASRDYEIAAHSMAKYQSQLEGVPATPEWRDQAQRERQQWLSQTPPICSLQTAAAKDPDYLALSQLAPEQTDEARRLFERLLPRHPNDWILKTLHAANLMGHSDPPRGEMILREQIRNPPDCFEGHSRLGTLLKRQGRLDEALAVYEDAVRRWPWHPQAVDACMWILTEGMTKQ